ncbi:Ger(x)C family spore germination protein [Lederbergia wuyishanensis]|uniref:Spore germination protein KC n=1 Tax=Lederbergia wuyishanensis TaxID=1347903 RepID=A0ABU0DA82_9BACI|nr:Ger(x)C family spore germination protein [Lederbergia wuyishanensis]MCJ8009958.1 Ger(x)C family spore germination protein [Lederbergia wuyishanensis]MDQ0345306.1 spore germination protein KC [Lederbergia wuyishanensis]
MKNKWILLFSHFVIITFLTGCGSQKELTDIAIVTALGIDKDENGMYVGTFQIVNPTNVAGGLQGGSAGEGTAVTVYTATGKNIVDVSRRASIKVSRLLYYAHTNLVVVSEDIAREDGISNILDALDRDVQFRTTTNFAIARNAKAADILSIVTPIDKIPAKKAIENLKFSEKKWGGNIIVNVREIIEDLTTTGKEPVIPGYAAEGNLEAGKQLENLHYTSPKATIHAAGLGVFKGDKLINWVDEYDGIGIVWILDKVKEANITVDWKESKDAISYQVMRDNIKVSYELDDSIPNFSIYIRVKGDLGEVDAPININDRKIQAEIEKKLEKKIKEKIQFAIKLAQQNKTDIFGFGEKIYRSNPDTWKTLNQDWNDERFPEIKVKITVDASILRTGLKTNPFLFQMDQKQKK